MARPLRIEFPGALYHVMSRGNERKPIARDERDRQKRLDWLRRTVETYGWRLHAFVLMRNHDHLFVETPEPNLSAGMQLLNGSYTGYFNRRHRRVGHLFQGRFKGHIIEEDGYFLEVSRYIHLNPVRAGIVAAPEQYPWSSYPGYCRARRALEWITYSRVLGSFSSNAVQTRRYYARFVGAGLADPPPSPFREAAGGLLLGSQRFIDRICSLLDEQPEQIELPELGRLRQRPSVDEIAAATARHFGTDAANWSPRTRSDAAGRAVAAYLVRAETSHRYKKVSSRWAGSGSSSSGNALDAAFVPMSARMQQSK